MVDTGVGPDLSRRGRRAEAVAHLLAVGDRTFPGIRRTPGLGVGPHRLPGEKPDAGADHPADGAPPVVGGVALFLAFGREGLLGRTLYDWLGIQFTFSTAGAVLAETFVAMPLLIVTVEAALRSMDGRYEEAAANLGAGRWTTFRRVTLPMISPSLVAGTALTWARALGEFGATITFAGDIQGRTQTLPLAIYLALQENEHVAVALSLALLAISVVVLVSLRGRWLGAINS
jgi:molybdate transport system permease protein